MFGCLFVDCISFRSGSMGGKSSNSQAISLNLSLLKSKTNLHLHSAHVKCAKKQVLNEIVVRAHASMLTELQQNSLNA